MLDGPKVSGLERWASIQQAGKGMDTASAWCLAVAVVRETINKGAHNQLSTGNWEARGMPGAQKLELLASGDSATAESQGPDM